MTENFSFAPPPPPSQAGAFNIEGRTVDAGRGWNWITEAFTLFRRQAGMWILVALLFGVLFIAVNMIPFLGALAGALLLPIFAAGLMLGCREQDQGGEIDINHLFAGFKQKTGDLVMVGVFNLVGWLIIGLVVLLVIGGGALMAIMRGGMPGVGISILSMLITMLLVAGLSVPIYMASWFAPALIVLNNMAPGAALKASFLACLKNMMPFLIYGLMLMLFGVLAAIPAGLGFLVLIPVLMASIYTAYRDIFCAAR